MDNFILPPSSFILAFLMSATSPALQFKSSASGSPLELRATLKRFSLQRRALRVSTRVLAGLSCVLVLLCLIGVLDNSWPMRRGLRAGLVLPLLISVTALAVYAVLSLTRRRRLSDMARDVERAAGRNDNALVTLFENLEPKPELDTQPYMLARLGAQARRTIETIDIAVVAPRRDAVRALVLLAFVLAFLLALRLLVPAVFGRELQRIMWLEHDKASSRNLNALDPMNSGNSTIAIDSFRVRVVPPAYSGLGVEEFSGDAPLRVLSGSQIEVDMEVRGRFESATIGFGGTTTQMRALGEAHYSGSFVANASGAFETRVIADQAQAPVPIVRAIEVYVDSPPEAHITEPVSDQLLRAVPASPISVRWTTHDDLGLADVVLKYIRSRGEGDSAQFVNGSVSLTGVDRASAIEWRGGATLPLARLGLQPGDTLVYWIEARDRNPSTNNIGRSASLAIAITAPEPVKLNLGDLGPNEIGRFLLSERMIIVHTEALHRDRTQLPRAEFLQRTNNIAAEQRDFKNSFNEYIKLEGVGVETRDAASVAPENVDERVQEAEAERTGVHMHGIPEPPSGSPSNVRDMIYAIRAMWDAEDALSVGDTARALIHEREALTRLKRAQSAVRYVPPVFARSRPIDLKRRYAGELKEIKTRLERLARSPESKETTSLRSALSEAYAALGDLQATLDVPVPARASAVARASDRSRQSANSLAGVGGDHATTIAEALGQLRIVESELSRLDVSGTADEYATRLSKSLSLLTRATANLFAIAEARTSASGGDANSVLPADERRTSEYFRRLNK